MSGLEVKAPGFRDAGFWIELRTRTDKKQEQYTISTAPPLPPGLPSRELLPLRCRKPLRIERAASQGCKKSLQKGVRRLGIHRELKAQSPDWNLGYC